MNTTTHPGEIPAAKNHPADALPLPAQETVSEYARRLIRMNHDPQGMGAGSRPPRRRAFVDLDGVVVNFDDYKTARGLTGEEVKRLPGAYLAMEPLPGALAGVRSLIGMGFEVWIATKPPTGVPHAYSDKAAWVLKHLPELKRRIIITHDKGLLGNEHDLLIDDRPHKANCEAFPGLLIRFIQGVTWEDVLATARELQLAARPGHTVSPSSTDTHQEAR